MNSRRITAAFLALALATISWARAASAASAAQPAAELFVRTPGAGTTWTIEVKPAEKDGAPMPGKALANTGAVSIPVRMETRIGTNQVRCSTTDFSDGRKEECYIFRGQMFRYFDNSKKIAALPGPPVFPGLEWLANGSAFAGKETVATRPCDKFKVTTAYLRSINWPEDTVCTAWISIEDRYPVQVRNGEIIYQFSPVTPFPQEIPLPADYKSAAEKSNTEQKALQMMQTLNRR